jgi:SAM-dependent methyltransferase
LRQCRFRGNLFDFLESETAKTIQVIEFNTAGRLSKYMEHLPGRRLLCYPEYDMMDIHYPELVDLVIHEDTLEHIPQPVRALSECRKLLKPGGALCFTAPTIPGRLTRSREGLEKSYHCTRGTTDEAMRVWWEFGADVWTLPLQAGFRSCAIESFEYPTALAITCLP